MTNFVGFFEKHCEILGKKTKGHFLSLVKVVLFIEFKSEIQILSGTLTRPFGSVGYDDNFPRRVVQDRSILALAPMGTGTFHRVFFLSD